MGAPLFTVYTELPRRLPQEAWRPLRWIGVAIGLGIAVAAIVDPTIGQHAFWSIFVPVAPLLFLVAPGLWRNTCPMASFNQIPRTLGFTQGRTLPDGVRRVAPLISAGLFLAIVPLRKVWLDSNGLALGLFLLAVLGLAFAGGVLFKGKSGWCSQFCPMLSVERVYNVAPIVLVPNSHCRPCVGCAKNCYDFNPTAAQLADHHDEEPRWADNRRLFSGVLPWLVVAFNTQDAARGTGPGDIGGVYGRLLLFCLAGAGGFILVEAVTRLSSFHVQILHVVAAVNLFYWYAVPRSLSSFNVDGVARDRVIQAAVLAVSVAWAVRAWRREKPFLESAFAPRSRASESLLRAAQGARGDQVEVSFLGGPTVLARSGEVLLAVAEANGVTIEAGCRMGMCGADPLKVLAGGDNLTPAGGPERSTLDRIGAGPACRMACVAKITGPVTVSTDLAAAAPGGEEAPATAAPVLAFVSDRTVVHVVVVGTGAAGVTAVNELRKLAPAVDLTIVGAEPYDFYNRMNIGKLVAETTSIDKLYMLPKDWAESRRIRALRGVSAVSVDRGERRVVLDSGERLPYDRVLIATGSRGNTPRLDGFGLPGTFILRLLDDGVAIQQHIRRRRAQTALVVGGGLLGIEAAYAMTSLGVRAYVVDRNPWPLNRQLDRAAGGLLWQLLKDLGIEVLPSTEARRLIPDEQGRVWGAELTDGRQLRVELCLAAAGVTPDIDLARRSGLAVDRGVLVDDRMATSDPEIYAAGDAVQHRGRTYGLWPACVDHARVAATNLLGGNARYEGDVPSCKLKVAGVDLLSAGDVAAGGEGAYELVFSEPGVRRYRKLVVADGAIRGGMLIGHADLADRVATAVQGHTAVEQYLERLRAGDWSVLPE